MMSHYILIQRHLISAIPVARYTYKKKRQVLEGEVPSPIHKPSGCAFHNRCPYCMDICKKEDPALRYHGADGTQTACHYMMEVR